ncbi:MAG: ABC transporter permease [Clostridia bacterium]|nr:ABC transporter permease [Clostridia bacterium]
MKSQSLLGSPADTGKLQARTSVRKEWLRSILVKAVFYILLLVLWEGLVRIEVWPRHLFPSPLDVLQSLITGFADKSIPIAVGASMERIGIGYLLSLAVGIPLGILIARVKVLHETVGSLVLGLQTLPSICWLPLAILWFGLNEQAIIFIVIIGAIFSITLSAESGVKNIPPLFLRAAKTMGAKGWRMYLEVVLPAALPEIITGMKLAWSFAWRSLMAGELLASGLGLGQVLMLGRDLADMAQVISVMIIIALLGLAIDRLIFARLENNVRHKWGLTKA